MSTAADYRRELLQMMADAENRGRTFLELSARELHVRVGPPRGRIDRMPNCCRVMKAQLAPDCGDVIVNEPPSGQGPTFTIRYGLPRRKRVEPLEDSRGTGRFS
jgi:hypothetical protein